MIEGSSGGGIVPWATLSGYGTRDELGTIAFATHVDSGDYRLNVQGVALTVGNRLELSVARQRLDLGTLQDRLGLPWNALGQDVFGAKLRLAGDLVYGHAPQVSLGVQYKRLRNGTLPLAIGARDDHGTDVYISASRLLLQGAGGYQLLLNGTLRGHPRQPDRLARLRWRSSQQLSSGTRGQCCGGAVAVVGRWAWNIATNRITSASRASKRGRMHSLPGSPASMSR